MSHKAFATVGHINTFDRTVSFIAVVTRGGDKFKNPNALKVSGGLVTDLENSVTFKAEIVGTPTESRALVKLTAVNPAIVAAPVDDPTAAADAAAAALTDGLLSITLVDTMLALTYPLPDLPVAYISDPAIPATP
ncbi:MAG: hypothetical protein WCH39_17260 [Schlesneria sp.]